MIFLFFIFKIGTGAGNTFTHAHFRSQKLTLFAMGVSHFEVKFHVSGQPVWS